MKFNLFDAVLVLLIMLGIFGFIDFKVCLAGHGQCQCGIKGNNNG